MRPLEGLLLLADLLAFAVFAVPLPRAPRWTRHLAPIPLLAAGTQVLVEGPRWQMIPAYGLSGVFFLIWLMQNIERAGRPGGRRINRVAARVLVAAGVLALVVSVVLPAILPVVRFPHPAGPSPIGTATYHWVDAARSETFTTDPNDRRELMVQIWYPGKADPSSRRASYIPDAGVVTRALARFLKLPEFIFGHLKYVTTHAIPAARVADRERRYPVLIFREGLGGYRQMNTFQVEELVSHGYVVAAIDQPYAAAMVVFPDGRRAAHDSRLDPPYRYAGYDPRRDPTHTAFMDARIPDLAQDVVFTLDQLASLNQADPNGILTGRLDLQRSGLFGHSLGGIVGAEACRMEPRLRACLLEDAFMPADVVRAGLQQATMWITRNADTMRLERRRSGGWPEPSIREHLATMRAVYQSLPGDGYYVQVSGMFHIDMTDAPLLSPLGRLLGFTGPIGGVRAHHIINAYSLAFFDRHLKGERGALLDGPAEQYPEVLLETRRRPKA